MDLFAKCFEPSLADEAKSRGIYPYFHALESRQDKEVIMEGKRRRLCAGAAAAKPRMTL